MGLCNSYFISITMWARSHKCSNVPMIHVPFVCLILIAAHVNLSPHRMSWRRSARGRLSVRRRRRGAKKSWYAWAAWDEQMSGGNAQEPCPDACIRSRAEFGGMRYVCATEGRQDVGIQGLHTSGTHSTRESTAAQRCQMHDSSEIMSQ